MASKEFIQKRITGKQREIAKITAKLERISKAEATNWTVNPYYYDESDLRRANRELVEAAKALAEYQDQLVKAEEMEASRNVPAITEFLDRWYSNCVEYFLSEKLKYNTALKKWYKVDSDYCNWFNHDRHHASKEERKLKETEYRAAKEKFRSTWSHVAQFNHGDKSWEETMKHDLKDEYNRKYDFIITRTNDIVGQITDASHLTVGSKGDLNGYILGTKGAAKVQTIGAGGYNIQCFHFRTLINPMKVEAKPEPKQPKVEITANMRFSGMSIEELKAILAQVNGSCKVYDNDKIYKMRLIMAIKKAI